jgi:hypothetical protein
MSIVALYLEIGEELEATFLTPNCQGDGKFDEATRAVITRRQGGTRLSQDRLPQHAADKGATDRKRLSGARLN